VCACMSAQAWMMPGAGAPHSQLERQSGWRGVHRLHHHHHLLPARTKQRRALVQHKAVFITLTVSHDHIWKLTQDGLRRNRGSRAFSACFLAQLQWCSLVPDGVP
jgi:hypothetical protein